MLQKAQRGLQFLAYWSRSPICEDRLNKIAILYPGQRDRAVSRRSEDARMQFGDKRREQLALPL